MTEQPAETEKNAPFSALRRFARQASARSEERCDLCGIALRPGHRHLLNLADRAVLCACQACSLLFDHAAGGGSRRLIPNRILNLTDFEMENTLWERLRIPVNMAFFCYNTAAKRMTAFYPSPMGRTE